MFKLTMQLVTASTAQSENGILPVRLEQRTNVAENNFSFWIVIFL